MSLSCKVGTFASRVGNGAQAITGLGFIPKAIIFWTATNTLTATLENSGGFGIGFVTSPTDQVAGSISASDGQVSSSVISVGLCIRALVTADLSTADLTSFDADGFTLSWSSNVIGGARVHYLALGGADITNAKAHAVDLGSTLGAKVFTGFGFQPDFVLFITGPPDAISFTTSRFIFADAHIGIGAMDSAGNQWAVTGFSRDAVSPSNTTRCMLTDACIAGNEAGVGIAPRAAFGGMNLDGYTLNVSAVTGFAHTFIGAIAIKGGTWKVGSGTKPVGAAPASQVVTGVGVTPRGLIFAGVQRTVNAIQGAHHEIGMGGASGVGVEQALVHVDRDGRNPTVVRHYTDAKSFIKIDNLAGTIDAAAGVSAIGADGFTLSWNPNDAVPTQIGWIAAGDAVAPASGGNAGARSWTNRPFLTGGF